MAKLGQRISHSNIKRRITWRVTILRRCISSFWNKLLACWLGKSPMYNRLLHSGALLPSNVALVGNKSQGNYSSSRNMRAPQHCNLDDDSSDLVDLKISILGDSQTGKTSFLTKYVGKEDEDSLTQAGIAQMDKTLRVNGARISYTIWEVPGDHTSVNHVPNACKGSVAILFIFDLTSRCTLNSILEWYRQARQCNQNAIPVLIGTKFDEFIQLPLDLQWTIASQARAYAKAINATLFFSSATYNINVNKIFKFITARLFDLPWTIERNLTIGEPIIDF